MPLRKLFGKKEEIIDNTEPAFVDLEGQETSVGFLNMEKGSFLNLEKVAPNLVKVRAAAGWDPALTGSGEEYDLDLCAFLLDQKGKLINVRGINSSIYWGAKKSTGLYLDGDDLTGGNSDGDDENIHVDLNKVPNQVAKVLFALVIHNGSQRNQYFEKVQNAYIRLVNEGNPNNEIELARFCLSENGGKSTAVRFAELSRTREGWTFKAIGDYSRDTISSISKSLK